MKLNKKGRDELRYRICLKLKDVDFDPNNRIKLPKDVLEELLFDVGHDDDNVKYKKFAYYNVGLEKLDLSKISFNDVSFKSDYQIDLSDTNAKIDFFKTYEWKKNHVMFIRNVKFKNVDLSNNEFVKLKDVDRAIVIFDKCNFSNTKMHLYYFPMTFVNCDLSNNDFSKLYLDPKGVEGDPSRVILKNGPLQMEDCNLANTGIKIGYNYDKLDISSLISKGYLDGCIFNGVKIKSEEEQQEESKELLKKYNNYKSNRINKVLDTIDEQLNHAGGRVVGTKECTGVGSFYGCGNVPAPKTKKKKLDNDCGSFYGCDN
jgi:uncharacterized protein YjbI with pentapeptide repeats